MLGKNHSPLLRRAELKTLVNLHGNEAGKGGELTHHETTIITGALDMTQKTAKDVMTPISETFSLDINSKLDMVYDNWPLYDILNQFQKGHSHMAVVVKCEMDAKENSEDAKPNMKANLYSKPKQTERRGINSPFGQKELVGNYPTDASSVYSSDTETRSPALENIMEKGHLHWRQLKKWKQGEGFISYEDLESMECLPSNSDNEAIGILSMEDVMEELLQEEILDETDEYVDVHNK
ncbi:hypothetical protein U1Q18_041697 [Sarracenia purpurea var. burkii]